MHGSADGARLAATRGPRSGARGGAVALRYRVAANRRNQCENGLRRGGQSPFAPQTPHKGTVPGRSLDSRCGRDRRTQNAGPNSMKLNEKIALASSDPMDLSLGLCGDTAKFARPRRRKDGRFPERNERKVFCDVLPSGSKRASSNTAAGQNHPSFGEKSQNPSRTRTPRLGIVARKRENSFLRDSAKLRVDPRTACEQGDSPFSSAGGTCFVRTQIAASDRPSRETRKKRFDSGL